MGCRVREPERAPLTHCRAGEIEDSSEEARIGALSVSESLGASIYGVLEIQLAFHAPVLGCLGAK